MSAAHKPREKRPREPTAKSTPSPGSTQSSSSSGHQNSTPVSTTEVGSNRSGNSSTIGDYQKEQSKRRALPGSSEQRPHNQNLADPSPSRGSSNSSADKKLSASKQQTIGKRLQYQRDDDQAPGSNNDDGGRRNDYKGSKTVQGRDLPYACPYFKYAPDIFGKKRTCSGPGWRELHRLKEHLARCHVLPEFACPRCLEPFAREALLNSHLRSDERCRTVQPPTHKAARNLSDGYDKEQGELLRKTRSGSAHDKWTSWYCVLFDKDPNSSDLPSPYQEVPTNTSWAEGHSQSSTHGEYLEFLRRATVSSVTALFEAELDKALQGMHPSIRTNILERMPSLQSVLLSNLGLPRADIPNLHVEPTQVFDGIEFLERFDATNLAKSDVFDSDLFAAVGGPLHHADDGISSTGSPNDIESIFTIGTKSTMPSTQSSGIEEFVDQWLIRMLLDDPELRELYPTAIKRLGTDRFRRNFARVLKMFGNHLKEISSKETERQAALFICNTRRKVAAGIQEMLEPTKASSLVPYLVDLETKNADLLEMRLRLLSRSHQEAFRAAPIDNDDDQADSDSGTSTPYELSNIEEVKRFILSSHSISYIRIVFRKWLQDGKVGDATLATKLTRTVEDLETAHVPLAESTTSTPTSERPPPLDPDQRPLEVDYVIKQKSSFATWINNLKSSTEQLIGLRLSWRPFSQPETDLHHGFTRVYSQFSCGWESYVDVPTSNAEVWFPLLRNAREEFAHPTPRKSRPAVFLKDKSLLQCLDPELSFDEPPQDAGEVEGSVPHKGNLQRSENGENIPNASAKGLGACKPEGNRPKDSHIAGDTNAQNQSIPESLVRPPSPFIFLTIEKDPRKKTCCTRPVAQGVSDKDTFTKLRSTYRTLRPGWLWEPIGIKFYRFEVFKFEQKLDIYRVELDRAEQRFPEPPQDKDYKFTPKPWKKTSLLPTTETLHYLEHPEESGTTSQISKKLPVRLTDIPKADAFDETGGAFEAFGIYIEQALPVGTLALLLVSTFVLVFGSTIWFIPFWLNKHPDDLQNATVPLVVTSAIVLSVTSIALAVIFFTQQKSH